MQVPYQADLNSNFHLESGTGRETNWPVRTSSQTDRQTDRQLALAHTTPRSRLVVQVGRWPCKAEAPVQRNKHGRSEMSLPPELQVLCRRLASTDSSQLPTHCPSLVRQIQRCGTVLSLPVDSKPKDGAPESSVLVHKLKTQITTLLNNGRSLPGRFSAAILIKAVVDVGGYECLRTAEPWVRGLLSMIQVCPPKHSTILINDKAGGKA